MARKALPSRTILPALRLVQSSRTVQRLAKLLLVLLGMTVVALGFVPWQQSARGTGQVVAFVPQERQQTVTSPVKGIVERIAPNLVEGMHVEEGDFILEISPNAANQVEQTRGQLNDLKVKLATAEAKADIYEKNIEDFTAARDYGVKAAQELVEAAQAKLEAKQRLVPAYEAKELQARLNYERQKGLFEKGAQSQKEVEKLRKDWDVAKAELESAQRDVQAALDELEAKQNELEQKRRELQTKIDYSRGMRETARGEAATIQKDLRDLEIKLAELDRTTIRAPRTGNIFRVPVFERGQAIKIGDPLFTIIPETSERAVELWVSGNDAPLVHEGDHVRLQFEGWPAVQFAGWPSVAIGTFGGNVAAIDATDNGKGQFRILIKPDGEQQWPSDQYLRQGVRANGWVMLQQVTLGYEIWRQLNGFPPVVSEKEPTEPGKDKTKPEVKLPK